MPRTTSPGSISESARRRRAAGVVPPPLSNTRGAVALEDACTAACAAAVRSAKAGLDYERSFHESMQASGFTRGEACTCGWAKIGRHTLDCGYTEQEGIDGTNHREV